MNTPAMPPADAMCRFCRAALIAKTYLAAPQTVSLGPLTFLLTDIEWGACVTCSALIEERLWDDLTRHVLDVWLTRLREKGITPDYAQRDRLRDALARHHAAVREAIGRTA